MALLFYLTAGCLPLFAAWAAVEGQWEISPSYVWPALGSILLNIAANLAFFESVRLSPLSVTVPLLSLTPAFAALAAIPLVGEWPGRVRGAGILLVVVGALLLHVGVGKPALGQAARAFLRDRGSLLMVLVAVLWSVAVSCDKLATERASPPVHAFFLFGGIGLATLGLLAAQGRLADLRAARETPWTLPASLVVGAVAFGLQLVVLKGGVLVGVVETVKRGIGNAAAVVVGRAVFGEAITPGKVTGVLLMAAGVALVMLGQ
jgi:drug/metabolite transporter (DMT)-like permease